VIIFDCNGVLVGSEEIAAAVLAEELTRAGIAITPQPWCTICLDAAPPRCLQRSKQARARWSPCAD